MMCGIALPKASVYLLSVSTYSILIPFSPTDPRVPSLSRLLFQLSSNILTATTHTNTLYPCHQSIPVSRQPLDQLHPPLVIPSGFRHVSILPLTSSSSVSRRLSIDSTMKYTQEEIGFIRQIYTTNREENWRDVSAQFEERFGRPLRQNQLRYVRLHYLFPHGQADNPRFANRRRGKKFQTRV